MTCRQLAFDFEEHPPAAAAPGLVIVHSPCRECRGVGSLDGPLPQLDFSMSADQIWLISEAGRIACGKCGGTGRAEGAPAEPSKSTAKKRRPAGGVSTDGRKFVLVKAGR